MWQGYIDNSDLVWQADHVDGTLNEWQENNQNWWNTSVAPSAVKVSAEAAFRGRWSVKLTGLSMDTQDGGAAKLKRAINYTEACWSCWHLYPELPTVEHSATSRLIIQQIKKEPDPILVLYVKTVGVDTLLELVELDDQSSDWHERKILPPNVHVPIPLIAGEWFNLKWYFKDGKTDGVTKIWHNGVLCWSYENIDTRGRQAGCNWGPVVYGFGIEPKTLVMYVDGVREMIPLQGRAWKNNV